jgi:hypothetical protein
MKTAGRIAQSVERLATGWMVKGSNPGGGEIFRTCPDWPWVPPTLLYNKYRVFPGGKKRPGRVADPSPLLVPWSRKSRAIPLLPLWNVWPVQSLSACTRVHFMTALHKDHEDHEDQYTFLILYRSFILRMRNVSDKSCRENRNTPFTLTLR